MKAVVLSLPLTTGSLLRAATFNPFSYSSDIYLHISDYYSLLLLLGIFNELPPVEDSDALPDTTHKPMLSLSI